MATPLMRILHPYRRRILITYLVSLGEFTLELLYPFAIGVAINGLLLRNDPRSLIPLAAIWLMQIAVGVIYQLTAARLFSTLHRRTATSLTHEQRARDISTSEVAGRVEMVQEVFDALNEIVPAVLRGAVGILGSIAMLFYYDLHAGAIAVGALIPIGMMQHWYGKRAGLINARLNDLRERQVDTVAKPTIARLTTHFRAVARARVQLSDTETTTWAISDLFALAAVIAVLWTTTHGGTHEPGSLYAVITYLITLSDSLETVPTLVDETTYFHDVSSRISDQLDDPPLHNSSRP